MDLIIIKIFIPAIIAFACGMIMSPVLLRLLYKYKVWKKEGGKIALNGETAKEFNKLKASKETKVPRMGGVVIWLSVFITVMFFWVMSRLEMHSGWDHLSFLSRSQTWIPVATILIGAGIGLLNDFYDVTHSGKGLRLRVRLLLISVLAFMIGFWFYTRLDVSSVNIPIIGPFEMGWLIIPFFIIFTLAVYASGVIDGIDGLSGGVFASIFTSYVGIAIIQQQYDIAALSATITGAILAFLWFNIPPARFYMTETGTMSLTLTLAVIAFMTDSLGNGYGISMLPIVAVALVATVFSNISQILYRKLFSKKLFRIAPLHHHFEAIGWPSYKVTMRYWVISLMTGLLGIVITGLLTI